MLERQLASSGGGNGNFSRYARAEAAQGQQIQIARAQARNAGCGGGFLSIFGGSAAPRSCGRMLNTINRMEANRAALLRKRDSLSPDNSGGSRRAVLAALDANGCRGAKVVNIKASRSLPAPLDGSNRSSLIDQIFGDNRASAERKDRSREKKIIQKVRERAKDTQVASNRQDTERDSGSVYVPRGAGGTVRTLCVRTCDGFYFPVSFSTTKDHFSKDSASCSALCPGAETKLYYHSVPDEEPEQMVDLTGEKYMSTPNAFKYRINGARSTPGCSCQAAQEAQTVAPTEPAGETLVEKAEKKAKKWVAIPQSRPDQMLDYETMANLQGGLTRDQLGEFLGKPDGTQATASLQPGKIRIVGPTFLPEKTGVSQDVQ